MPIPVIDLFAGPGGLGEGFASLRGHKQQPFFEIGLSIEKTEVAHRTLMLRAAFRRLRGTKDVRHYYSYIRGEIDEAAFRRIPAVASAFEHAAREARCLELGKSDETDIDAEIRSALNGQEAWVLIGGPPCQAYSLAGRSRRANDKEFHKDEIVNEKLEVVGRHLALVFHRFLSGEVKGHPRITLAINGHPIAAFDPFCRKNSATQVLPEEIVRIGDAEVRLQPYVLPHHSRLSASEYDYYQDRSDFISNQGGYVYRNGRLMAWGDWFRLVPKGEATKLARVQIDFPNSLDEAWTIDIKKSRARPPHAVRERLRQIIARITSRSVTVHRGRGQKLFQETQAPFWERYADHDGIRFAINARHPIIVSLAERLSPEDADLLRTLLDSVAASLPVEMIYSDYSTHAREINQRSVDESQTMERLRSLRQVLYGDGPGDAKAFLQIVRSTHLFDGQMDLAEKFISEAFA